MRHLLLGAAVVSALACSPGGTPDDSRNAPAAMTDSADAPRWRTLFDGTSTSAWRGYQMDSLPAGWQVEDGSLVRAGGGGDIITRDQFGDFELELEWKVGEGGNSGIMYRVTEADSSTYRTGPEYQVLDDAAHQDGQNRLTSAGSAYGLYAAPAGVVKPAGEWNTTRIVAQGAHVEHWLNGQKVVEYELWSPDWEAKVKASKFVEWSGYGRSPRGHIALQDHGDRVEYRNIRIREVAGE
jgi:hypothetical protein